RSPEPSILFYRAQSIANGSQIARCGPLVRSRRIAPVHLDQAGDAAELSRNIGIIRGTPEPATHLRLVDWIMDMGLAFSLRPFVRNRCNDETTRREQLLREGTGIRYVLQHLKAGHQVERGIGSIVEEIALYRYHTASRVRLAQVDRHQPFRRIAMPLERRRSPRPNVDDRLGRFAE